MERIVPKVVHPVQCGTVPERITLPRPDDEILSGYDKDVSSYETVMLLGEYLILVTW